MKASAKIADDPALAAMQAKIAEAHAEVTAAIDALHHIQADGFDELNDELGIENALIPAPEVQIEATAPTPMFTTADDFVTATRKLIAQKKYEDEDEDEEEGQVMTMPESGPRRELRAEAVLGRIEARRQAAAEPRIDGRDCPRLPGHPAHRPRIHRHDTRACSRPGRGQPAGAGGLRRVAQHRRIPIDLGFPEPWDEHEMCEHDPEIDRKFRCVDCDKSVLGGEYYMVADELWAASGMEPNGGMLCLVGPRAPPRPVDHLR